MSKFIIYALVESGSRFPRYVGKSVSGLRRAKNHFCPSLYEKHDYPVYRWIRKRLAAGVSPKIVVLEECSSAEDLVEAEQFQIAYMRSMGARLLNVTAGGDGALGRVLSAESRAKISRANAKWQTDEKREQIAASLREFYADPERREELRARILKSQTPELRARQGAAQKKRWERPGAREEFGARVKARLASPEARLKLSTAKRGKANPKKCRPITDQYGTVYASIRVAAAALGCATSTIHGVLSGMRSSHRGLVFTYVQPNTSSKESA